MTKLVQEVSIDDALEIWQNSVTILKKHIYSKRVQQSTLQSIKQNLKDDEIMIYVDYSENYKVQHQNEIQSAYFGHSSFSIFTACTFYRDLDEIKKIPLTVTTEMSDKSRIGSLSCVDLVVNHSISKIDRIINKIVLVSDGCAAQFRSRYIFKLLTKIQPGRLIEWHYNEAHHGKGPMDGIGGTVKNKVFRKVLSRDLVIDSASQFASVANDITNVESLYLGSENVLDEPEDIDSVSAIPETLKTHKVVRKKSRNGVFYNEFFYLSVDSEPHFTQWYGDDCRHEGTFQDDNTCAQCSRKYHIEEDWLKCPLCNMWFHEQCFFA